MKLTPCIRVNKTLLILKILSYALLIMHSKVLPYIHFIKLKHKKCTNLTLHTISHYGYATSYILQVTSAIAKKLHTTPTSFYRSSKSATIHHKKPFLPFLLQLPQEIISHTSKLYLTEHHNNNRTASFVDFSDVSLHLLPHKPGQPQGLQAWPTVVTRPQYASPHQHHYGVRQCPGRCLPHP